MTRPAYLQVLSIRVHLLESIHFLLALALTRRGRLKRGSGSLGWRSGLEIATTAEIGSYRFIRTGAIGQLMVPLPGPLVGAAEVGGGTAFGELPLQRQWYLGGFSTLRGFAAEERIGGDSYWRVRAEVGTEFPGIRVVGFSDFGTAGPRRDLSIDPQMLSAGAGVSFLSGLIRFDLARALRGGSGWRLDVYIGGPL